MAETAAKSQVPKHIGIILDGNRRWAKERGKSTLEGHRAGYDTLNKIADSAFKKGVKELSVYAFSTENWKRSKAEVKALMNLVRWIADRKLDEFHKKALESVFREIVKGLNQIFCIG